MSLQIRMLMPILLLALVGMRASLVILMRADSTYLFHPG